MDKLVVTIKPSGPHNEVLISLAKQIKKERGRHVPKYDPLQIKKQKYVGSTESHNQPYVS